MAHQQKEENKDGSIYFIINITFRFIQCHLNANEMSLHLLRE